MLTKDIKKTIDNARDVLVGKIPNPQSQIEQITIAMIYKFMDDMDLETVEFGGERQFFAGDMEKYAWSKLMSPQLGADARMNLYTEALDRLPLEQSIPKLFRDIFKGAYLPFRDGHTLTLFLKEINDISYNNSENLGNGFEYLLSIMGSQGDAGQFRTPRHIIDFIVDIVKPAKNDAILDPACGTAGFLISAFKYITDTAKSTNQLLTPDELKSLTENIQGYDISPDMVKLALVNMYLHKFKEPKIYEYDTLTKLDRWDNYFDVILANPPFMTPKGGIQPHNRFGVKANRSEVLFVDYIMEHLNSTGRAGIIVPEGIVFQSANAYKELRKKLVEENYLYGVISLPSGVFQPYSGVKTSILLLDKQLAKKTDKILFVEIQNDGFDLGAQRRQIDKNDLPKAVELINQWQETINIGHSEQSEESHCHSELVSEFNLTTLVEKSKLAENGEYNLTASRYKEVKDYSNCKWDMVKLGDVCEILDNLRKPVSKANRVEGIYPYYGASGIVDYIDEYIFDEQLVLIGEDGAKWGTGEKSAFIATGQYWVNNHCHILRPNRKYILDELLVNILNELDLTQFISGCVIPKLTQKDLKNIEIPLPPIEVQEEIVKELDSYQSVIDGAQKVIDNWKPTIPTNPNWQKVKLGDVLEYEQPTKYIVNSVDYDDSYKIPVLTAGQSFVLGYTNETMNIFNNLPVIIFDDFTTATKFVNFPFKVKSSAMKILKANTTIANIKYLYNIMQYIKFDSSTHKRYWISEYSNIEIPLPSIDEQNQIVSKIEEEEQAIEQCKKLIEIHKQKINDKIQSIWEQG